MKLYQDNPQIIDQFIESEIVIEKQYEIGEYTLQSQKLKSQSRKDSEIDNQEKIKIQPLIMEKLTGETTQNRLKREFLFKIINTSEFLSTTDNNKESCLKGKKIFKIQKLLKYSKLNELYSDEELELMDPKFNKISAFSKVNFSNLKEEGRDEQIKNLSILAKRLRRKVRYLECKIRFNVTKLLNNIISNKLGYKSHTSLQQEFQFNFNNITRALRKVRNFDNFEFDDQKHLIENVIDLLASDKLKLDSISYKKICSIVRRFIPQEKIKYISRKDPKVVITFPQSEELHISNKEFSYFSSFQNKEEIIRAIFGIDNIPEQNSIVLNSELPIEKVSTNNDTSNLNYKDTNYDCPNSLMNYLNILTSIFILNQLINYKTPDIYDKNNEMLQIIKLLNSLLTNDNSGFKDIINLINNQNTFDVPFLMNSLKNNNNMPNFLDFQSEFPFSPDFNNKFLLAWNQTLNMIQLYDKVNFRK